MPLHDVTHIAGVSEACRYNDHEQCRAPNCGCTCHKPPVIEASTKAAEPTLEKACPKCGCKRPAAETYCRIDGSRLASLICGVCGVGMNPEDSYCFNCGGPNGIVTSVQPKVPPKVKVTMPEDIDYSKQVLKGLQEAFNGNQSANGTETLVQKVVEQPAGPQGSFRLVSAPNPNKIRGPAATPNRTIRLPIKPS